MLFSCAVQSVLRWCPREWTIFENELILNWERSMIRKPVTVCASCVVIYSPPSYLPTLLLPSSSPPSPLLLPSFSPPPPPLVLLLPGSIAETLDVPGDHTFGIMVQPDECSELQSTVSSFLAQPPSHFFLSSTHPSLLSLSPSSPQMQAS